MDTSYLIDFGLLSKNFFRYLANVLLHRIQNLEKEQEKNLYCYQTLVKKHG